MIYIVFHNKNVFNEKLCNPENNVSRLLFYQFDFLMETLVHPFLVGSIEEDYS